LAGPAAAFAAGIALVGRDVEGPAVVLFTLGPLALVGWAGFAVALALGPRRGRAASTVLGAALTAAAFMAGVLGTFVPYAAGWGDHELDLYGEDFARWQRWQRYNQRGSAFCGILAGAVVGFMVWVFRPAATKPV